MNTFLATSIVLALVARSRGWCDWALGILALGDYALQKYRLTVTQDDQARREG